MIYKTVAYLICNEKQYSLYAQVKDIDVSPFLLTAEDLGHNTLSGLSEAFD